MYIVSLVIEMVFKGKTTITVRSFHINILSDVLLLLPLLWRSSLKRLKILRAMLSKKPNSRLLTFLNVLNVQVKKGTQAVVRSDTVCTSKTHTFSTEKTAVHKSVINM